MGVFDQMGDPVCPPCVCQHHGVAYEEQVPAGATESQTLRFDMIGSGATIVQAQIITTERCCIAVNVGAIVGNWISANNIEIERPVGTVKTSQRDQILTGALLLTHHAAWEELPAGTYTYHVVNTAGNAEWFYGTWIKIIASDCEG